MIVGDLFQVGMITLSSGQISNWKIECDALTDLDIESLAHIGQQLVTPFSTVVGIPTGGIRFASAMFKYASVPEDEKGSHLIVDDVYSTGRQMLNAYNLVCTKYPLVEVKGLVLFARGDLPIWCKAIFQTELR